MTVYNKLVRDKIPQRIQAKGGKVVTHIAQNQEYLEKLDKKLLEEVQEFLDDKNPKELADVLEVVYALGKVQNLGKEDLEKMRQEKYEERGGFEQRIILESSEDVPNL